jgi:hypothetical protein
MHGDLDTGDLEARRREPQARIPHRHTWGGGDPSVRTTPARRADSASAGRPISVNRTGFPGGPLVEGHWRARSGEQQAEGQLVGGERGDRIDARGAPRRCDRREQRDHRER